MTADTAALPAADPTSPGLWQLATRRLRRDRVGSISLVVVLLFVLVSVAAALGVVAEDWQDEVGVSYAPPSFLGRGAAAPDAVTAAQTAIDRSSPEAIAIPDPLAEDLAEIAKSLTGTGAGAQRAATLPFGADKWGRDVLAKTIKGTQTSLLVGLASALVATLLGTLFGAAAGFMGGRTDAIFNWLYSVLTSIPYLLLILAIAAVLGQKGTATVVLILGLTGWTGIFRLVRAEYLKHKVREYVVAADAIGASRARRMFVHILPNVGHVVLVQLSLHVVLFIKSEVILSFLGFGVGVDTVSWGSMLSEAQNELLIGKWWQLAAATAAMAALVTTFSLFTDALRDALDPRLT
ncbi:MAG TPA: ABC transporter permease [Burkholderiales bacterium]|nr:ABC transporter permease [Burkholderiales bacterium]